MRKFIKILVAMVAVSMTAIGSIQSAKAVWPPAVWPPERRLSVDEATYNFMITANEPVATYCFYNPDTLGHIDSLTLHGYDDVNPNKTVAICLKTQEAQRRFREHFEDRFRDLHIDSRENLFIISVGDSFYQTFT